MYRKNLPRFAVICLAVFAFASLPVAAEVVLAGRVIDEDTQELLPCRVHVSGNDGVYIPPAGHVLPPPVRPHNNNIEYESDLSNRGKGWASIEDGTFRVTVPAIDGVNVEIERGLEYPRLALKLDLVHQSGEIERTFTMKRAFNMRELGWMSGDTHVHNLTPAGTIRQMRVEALDYVNLMFVGPGHPLLRRGFVTGEPSDVSTDEGIVYVSQEQRDAQQGHLTTLNMKKPIQPIRGYTGKEVPGQIALPNEPLNWEVYDYLQEQDGLVIHAHYLYWPGYSSPVSAALGKLDGVEWLTPDLVVRGPETRQNIEAPGFPLTGAGPMWYYMLNCGAKLPVVGGTDKMSCWRIVGGGNRTYVKVDEWGHEGFIDGIRKGRTFVSNGPMLDFTVNGQPLGSELEFSGEGPFTVNLKAECRTTKPIEYFQLVKNGEVIAEKEVGLDERYLEASGDVVVDESCWFAVRAGHRSDFRNNWEHARTAAHSSPIYVTVNGELPSDEQSARYMLARMETGTKWCDALAMYSSEEYKQKALDAYQQATDFYQAALDRALTK